MQVSHYLIYQVWMCQVYSSTILYFHVDPEEVLKISLNSQDKFGSLEVLYTLVNFLLIRTHKYQVVCVQGVHFFSSVKYALAHFVMCESYILHCIPR